MPCLLTSCIEATLRAPRPGQESHNQTSCYICWQGLTAVLLAPAESMTGDPQMVVHCLAARQVLWVLMC
jgi:hypothetical protein